MITMTFSCKECGLVKQPVQVPARETVEHDVVHYMKNVVTPIIADEHRRLSPNCKAETITDLMIPIDGAEFIGQQIE